VKTLILQMVVMLLPTMFYEGHWLNSRKPDIQPNKNNLIIGFFCAISVILCLISPSIQWSGIQYDMRDVPIFISILYGGYEVGFSVTALMLFFRFFQGGDGFFLTLVNHAMVLPFVFYGIKRYGQYTSKKRIQVAGILGLFISMVIGLTSIVYIGIDPHFDMMTKNWIFISAYVAINTSGITLAVYLMEKNRNHASLISQVQESEKLRVVSHLAASIAHEVRNPLTSIRGFIQLLAKDQIEQEKKQMYAELMIRELDRAQSVITDYLTYAKPDADNYIETLDVKKKIINAANVMTPLGILHGVAIETDLEEHLFIRADRNKFTQVLVNLIKNAIEAMPQGGTVTVKAKRSESHVTIDVNDEGIGIPQEKLKHLGDPFFSTKEKGTGLGLMVCYRIIQSLNGEIKVSSEVGKGTHFYIIIPLYTMENPITLNTTSSLPS
jgi:two-component system, sporulation sensor kinase B